jgi:hypothetical protein
VTYTVTHHRIECAVVERRAGAPAKATARQRWVKVAALASLAMTSPGRRIARLLMATGTQPGRRITRP